MIAHVRGRIVSRGPEPGRKDALRVVVDVDGVGYLVIVPAGATAELPGRGEPVALHTSLQVREDAMTLYGFPTGGARDLFEALVAASGVGPRLALAAISTLAPDTLRRAVAEGDVDVLTAVPGIGRKSAQRLVLELRDRLAPAASEFDVPVSDRAASAHDEVRLALVELGYTQAEAHRAVAEIDGEGDVAELLRAALRSLAVAGRA